MAGGQWNEVERNERRMQLKDLLVWAGANRLFCLLVPKL